MVDLRVLISLQYNLSFPPAPLPEFYYIGSLLLFSLLEELDRSKGCSILISGVAAAFSIIIDKFIPLDLRS